MSLGNEISTKIQTLSFTLTRSGISLASLGSEKLTEMWDMSSTNKECHVLVYLYQCLYSYLVGFTGTNCEINIDDCRNNECQNGAVCVDGIEEYTCQCTPQWTGKA